MASVAIASPSSSTQQNFIFEQSRKTQLEPLPHKPTFICIDGDGSHVVGFSEVKRGGSDPLGYSPGIIKEQAWASSLQNIPEVTASSSGFLLKGRNMYWH